MAASNFFACFNETESFEGGYVNNPHDPGGATEKGVTQAVYSAWLAHHGRVSAPVKSASDADIQAIYRSQYWNAVRGDDLYDGLDLVMVDTAWGSGSVEAIKFLQRQLGVVDDGQFGILTLGALKTHPNSTDLLNKICAERETFFRSLPTWKYFGVGWEKRLMGIHAKALEMNVAALSTAPALVGNGQIIGTVSMFSFSTLFSILTNAPTVLNAAVTVGEEAITDVQTLLKTPGVQALEAFIAANFTHVVTPGAAAILEPKSVTPGKA